MKKIIPLVFFSSVALVQIFGAENPDQPPVSKSRPKPPQPAPHVAPKIQRNVPPSAIPPKAPNPNAVPRPRVQPNPDVPRPINKISQVRTNIPPYTQRKIVSQPNAVPSAEDAPQTIKKPGAINPPLPPFRQPNTNPQPVVPRVDDPNDRTRGNNPNRHHRDQGDWRHWT